MLFNIYITPLGEVIRSFGVSCQYADDTQLYLSFHPSAVDAVPSLECCLDMVLGWMRENRLRLNLDKMEILQVGPPRVCGLGASLSFSGVSLTTKDEVRRLGVLFILVLSMESQIASVVHNTLFSSKANCSAASLP